MKICYVVDNLGRAGWGRLATELGTRLQRRGHDVVYVTERAEDVSNVILLKLHNFRIKEIPLLCLSIFKLWKAFRMVDVVVCFDAYPYGLLTVLANIFARKRVILYALGTYSIPRAKSYVRNYIIRVVCHNSYAVFVVSKYIMQRMEMVLSGHVNVQIVPVGVNTDTFYPDTTLSTKITTPYILSVGALKHRKGYHLLLEALALVITSFPDIKWVIRANKHDSDRYTSKFLARIDELGLREHIVWVPELRDEELRSLYSHAILFALTPVSEYNSVEGFGMVYLEAGACGLAVLGTTNSGAEEAIKDGVTGKLVNPSPEMIAKGIKNLLSSPTYRLKMGGAGVMNALKYDWDRIVDLHLAAF